MESDSRNRSTLGDMTPSLEDPMESHSDRVGRFFARILSADMECPTCGAVLRFGGRGRRAQYWDRVTNRLKCPHCRRTYQLGVLAWPVMRRPGSTRTPEDHRRPTRRRGEIPAYERGFWMTEPRGCRAEITNLTCMCEPGTEPSGLPRSRCPIHGEGGLSQVVPNPPSLP